MLLQGRATEAPAASPKQTWLHIKVFSPLQDAGGWAGGSAALHLPFPTMP